MFTEYLQQGISAGLVLLATAVSQFAMTIDWPAVIGLAISLMR